MKNKIFTLFFLVFFAHGARADESTYIAVGKAKTKRTVVALADLKADGAMRIASDRAMEIVNSDLVFMDQFSLMGKDAFVDKSTNAAPGTFKLDDWKKIGVEFVFKGTVTPTERGLAFEAYLYNTLSGQPVLSKRYLSSLNDTRALAHTIANDIVNAITGLPGIFQTKITMVCDRTRNKEVYVMDFDGSNAKQISKHRSITLSPAWSPDGTRIAYSLIAKNRHNIKNTNLYEFDFRTSTVRLLSDRHGINSGANYHPDGQKIVLTMNTKNN